jgi:cytochrome d ubiquinol oxidase subunit I
MEMRWALEIPSLLSLLVYRDPNATVTGLENFPRDTWPSVQAVHTAFDVMILLGSALLALAAWAAWLAWRHRRLPDTTWFLRALVVAAPAGFVAVEAGWVVTEMGRQPWIIHDVMRTADAVTPMPGLAVPFTLFTAVYLLLSVVLVALLRREFTATAPARSTGAERRDAA